MRKDDGFTLIELSIVLVIIGLIVGGVLVGGDMIRAAEIRAEIAQIEKYQTAVNTFRNKYNALPGDMPAVVADQFGFSPRGTQQGEGDGNGVIEGIGWTNGAAGGEWEVAGETAMFWVDLSTVKLVDGGFTQASSTTFPGGGVVGNADITGTAISLWLPAAKIGRGNYVYVWSADAYSIAPGSNYFGLSVVTSIIAQSGNGNIVSSPGLTVQQAYAIDTKIDDGFPQTGRVIAEYLSYDEAWPDGTNAIYHPPNTSQTSPGSGTCYDNGGVAGTQYYSMTYNAGRGVNCALSFRFQ